MDVEISPAAIEDEPALARLFYLYQYDFSEFDGSVLPADGRFRWIDWTEIFDLREAHVYLVRVDGEVAGFASLCMDTAMRDPNETVWWMHDFFVMRRYRGRGTRLR